MELAWQLLSNLFPSRCIFCQKTVVQTAALTERQSQVPDMVQSLEVCSSCYQALPHNKTCCVRCALPLAEDIGSAVMCGRCIKKQPAFDYAHSPFRYQDEIITLVHQLKFSEKIRFSRSIGEMLMAHFSGKGEMPDCLLPVALHPSRMRQRGFNQSIEIARVLSKKLVIPIEHSAIVRQKSTVAQTGLSAKQRQKNIRGAFSVVGALKYKHVLIVDDVMTTGVTVNELAKLLKKNNVERVGVLSIARAPVKG